MSILLEKLNKEELVKAIANDPYECFLLAKKYVEKYKEPPEFLVRGLTQRKKEEWTGIYNYSVAYDIMAKDHGIKVPDYVIESILENEHDAYDYLVKMINQKQIIPDNFLNTYFEKYYSPPSDWELIPILSEEYSNSKDVEMWYNYAANLLDKKLEIPENIINAVSKSIYFSRELIEKILYRKKDVSEILLNTVSLSPRLSYYSAVNFIEYGKKEVPEILNKSIVKDPEILDMYNEFLSERKKNRKIIESVTINEKLDKEELKQVFLKSPDVAFKFSKSMFLDKNEEPPMEFLNVVAKSRYSSYHYFIIAKSKKMNVPDIIMRGVLQDPSLTFTLWKEFGNFVPLDDITKSICLDPFTSFNFYKIQKERNKKVPSIIWKSLLSNETVSYYIAKIFLEEKKSVPDVIIRGFISNPSVFFPFAMQLLNGGLDLPKIMLNAIAENAADYYEGFEMSSNFRPSWAKDLGVSFETILFIYLKKDKKIPDILLNAVNKKSGDDISVFCMRLGKHNIKIPDKILDIFIEKTPKHGVPRHLGVVSYKILSSYLIENTESELNPEKVLKTIPTRLYQYVISGDIAGVNQTKQLIRGFLTVLGKVPEDFKQAIIDEYGRYSYTIPQEIADAAGIKQSKTIDEKLNKEKLLDAILDSWSYPENDSAARNMLFNLLKMGKEIPDKLAIFASYMPASILKFVIKDIIAFGKNEVPEIILKSISKDKIIRNNIAMVYKNYNQEIPKIIMDSLNSEQKEFYNSDWFPRKKPIEEKLDKNELLDSVASNLDKNDILNFAYDLLHINKELPDNILKIISDRPNWAAHHIINIILKNKTFDTTGKDLHILLKSVSEDVYQSGELIKSVLRIGYPDVPDVLLKSIARNGLITKHVVDVYILKRKKIPIILQKTLEAFKQKHPLQANNLGVSVSESQKTITEKLDKDTLLNIVAKKPDDAFLLFWNFKKFRENPHDIPEKLKKAFTKNSEIAFAYAKHIILLDSSAEKIPPFITKAIAKDARESFRYAQDLINQRFKIPRIILKGISSNSFWFNKYNSFISDLKSYSLTDSRSKKYFKQIADGTLMEKLDKEELLGVIQKDYDAYIDIMNHYFQKKKEYPPEEFLKMATETDEASRIFAEYCLEHKKDIPDDVIKKVAENPKSAYTIAALMIWEKRKVPEILIKSIHSDPLSLKHFKEFVKSEESRFHIPTSYYAKI